MKKVIVTTTINAPTEAIRRFDVMPDWHLIVIGDLKTPEDYVLAQAAPTARLARRYCAALVSTVAG